MEKGRAEVRSRKDMIEKKAELGRRRECGSPGTREHKEVLAGNVDSLPSVGLYLKLDWRRNVTVPLGRQKVGQTAR